MPRRAAELLHDFLQDADERSLRALLSLICQQRGISFSGGETQSMIQQLRAMRVVVPRLARLTAREIQVVWLLAAGLSQQQMAARLGISRRTVRQHLENMQTKLQVSGSRALLAHVLNFEQWPLGTNADGASGIIVSQCSQRDKRRGDESC